VNNPLVSIIIPAYNAENYIPTTLGSVLDQSYQNWEVIIIDDGSKDKTAFVCEKFLSDKRIHYFFQKNQGVAAARNLGITKSKGEYVAFLDADDFWLPENLSEKLALFEKQPEADWVFSDMYESDADLKNLIVAPKGTDINLFKTLLAWEGEVIPGTSSNIILRRKCVSDLYFDIKTSTAADLDFTIRLAYKYKGARLPKPLIIYRQLNKSMSRNINVMEHDCMYIYHKAAKLNLFHSFLFKQKCFSNMYLVLAGSWWVNGQNKVKGGIFILRALLNYPPVLIKLLKKLF
jgi:glycosyltransferase involved in cell wall biosynthesis